MDEQQRNHTAALMVAFSPLAMIVVDPYADKLLDANSAACELLNINEALPLKAPFSHRLSASLPLWVSFTDETLVQKTAWSDDLVILDMLRQPYRVEVYAQHIEDSSQLLLTLIDRNKAEQRRAKAELGRQHRQGEVGWQRVEQVFERIEKQNQLILGAAGEGIYGLDAEGKTTFVNPAAERILGWSTEDMVGHDAHLMFHHTHADGSHFPVQQCPIHASFSDGQVHHVDNEVFWHKNGEAIPVEYTSTPIFEMGRLVGAVVLFRDIRERKRAEQQLRDALAEVESLKQRLELENEYLQEEIKAELNHRDIVGNSPAVAKLIQQIELVAPTSANVLISGESGTGKELIARAIHAGSSRSDRPLIRVNCAAIPRDLFESEFFGHVKGAFTGAVQDRPGRFELAHGGTLFLDEVGEIPLELQSKLLRVLQDQQFERVGDNRTREVDVRVIAATNRDLRDMIEEGHFREDLYFRLNVFPIDSVPLRKRIEDVPLLARHFLQRACLKFNKPGVRIPPAQLEILQRYPWPGNIRELENIIERQVIVTQDRRLMFDDLLLGEPPRAIGLTNPVAPAHASVEKSETLLLTEHALGQRQRESTIAALERAGGKVSGAGGAAELLGIKPTTLASRLNKWGIDTREFRRREPHLSPRHHALD
ncbi:sigma 54-interacting transcriptional regulator [Halomonas sp. FeN2]|jgi:PAS domain S-box-containing protein|uniref:Sigma 54-interacting transcriptional regulator n=1 Tax=Vreelandella neptunia TaxID=115551 RepID=A0ABZ0YRV2_9GAMM|nr:MULTISPECIES: sigma 54-interacting transcriptional regulator [Halomonas]TDV98065.1 PAS domain S-box-containing protein [Halomonas alkaliantarctica]MBF59285.1 Fis family transcriptional regulator [Halomonas sp.]MDN3558992.1 sigma 54-interacting transcriptional regulator [Halomonas neptunia]UBR49146.1 sigma 54-interacting transcriptional regulator [Halomonas sp. FeN2]WQH13955.1 sigma 54-interacting transcriptional regulator [Halomonas neptunia]|tara:strand:+ start:386 stop:2341 length:1956 start_codon:yes stop_codon:yes gene_type:complete